MEICLRMGYQQKTSAIKICIAQTSMSTGEHSRVGTQFHTIYNVWC